MSHSVRIALVVALVCAGCAAREVKRTPPPRPKTQPVDPYTAWQQRPSEPVGTPTAYPVANTPAIRESEIRQPTGVVLPTDKIPEGEPTPKPTGTKANAEIHPTPEVVAAIPRSESLLPRIKPETPGNQAAALHLVDEGRQLIDQKRYDQAGERLERAVSIDPTNAYGYYYLAQLKYLRKDYSQAVAFAQRSVALSSRLDRGWQSRANTLQAEIFEEVGRYRDARAAYTKAMQLDPTNLSARVGAARVSPGQESAPAPE